MYWVFKFCRMKEIRNREDIFILVSKFYEEIRKDKLLGPVFNSHIPDSQWPKHLKKLTDFWETTLLGVVSFKGNPSRAHMNVDKGLNYKMNQIHFEKWLQIWFTTIDSLYEGQLAQRAKDASRKMATGQYLNVWKRRPENQ